mmetsp:Transcript_8645/g.17532  ORF Transcript_8645/g.17532 Transcript_8645/m.17532 type:complete len:322 (+) Transcript_8645:1113-2078(+)
MAVMRLEHVDQVNDVLVVPSGGVLAAAGGPCVSLWDISMSGRKLMLLESHAKAVMNLGMDGSGTRLLSGGLDGCVKVTSMSTFEIEYTFSFNGQVLAISLGINGDRVAAGLSSGEVVIRQRSRVINEDPPRRNQDVSEYILGLSLGGSTGKRERTTPFPGTKRYFERGNAEAADEGENVAWSAPKPRFRVHDKLLRSFQYSAALDSVLGQLHPATTCTVLEELILRDGLVFALRGRTGARLTPLIVFLSQNITTPFYTRLLVSVTFSFLEICAPQLGSLDENSQKQLGKLRQTVRDEIELQKELQRLLGTVAILVSPHPRE